MFGSWSVPFYHPSDRYNAYNATHPAPKQCTHGCAPLSNVGLDEPWQTFNDAKSALHAVDWINNASEYDAPFFLAAGFHRPHIPYVYPKEFEFKGDVDFPPKNYYITKDVPIVAPHDWTSEGMRYGDLSAIRPGITDHHFHSNLSSMCTAVPFAKQAEMRRSYLSCIQYIDHLVGQLIGALKSNNLYENTVVIFWGDHGYKTGEHCDWFKHDNYEDSTRIPVIVKPASASGVSFARGAILEQLVEEIDIFPSLIELAGMEVPGDLQVRVLDNLRGAAGTPQCRAWIAAHGRWRGLFEEQERKTVFNPGGGFDVRIRLATCLPFGYRARAGSRSSRVPRLRRARTSSSPSTHTAGPTPPITSR